MTEIPTLDERLNALAGRLRSHVDGAGTDAEADRAMTEAAAALEILASAGATGALVEPRPVSHERWETVRARDVMRRELAEALGSPSSEERWEALLDSVEALASDTTVNDRQAELVEALECHVTEGADWDELIARVRGTMAALENERRAGRDLAATLEEFVDELHAMLGLDPQVRGAIARQQVIGNVRALVQRLAAKSKQAERAWKVRGDEMSQARSTLVDMLKALQTYAPGHDEMSVEDLRAEVNTVLARTLKELHNVRALVKGLGEHVRSLNTALGVASWSGVRAGERAIEGLRELHRVARQRIDAAAALHVAMAPGGDCYSCDSEKYPCPTRQALDPDEGDEDPDNEAGRIW